MPFAIHPDVDDRVERLELPFNRYGLDPYGISKSHLKRYFSLISWFYEKYLDVRCYGMEHVPARGRAMIVSNHSGGWALDAGMILASMLLEPDPPRLAQGMADKFIHRLPLSSALATRMGQLCGLPEHAKRLLEDDRLLMVFPEGHRGTAKLYHQRNSLVGFGTGFVRLALETRTPIVPAAFIGGGEAIPTIFNAESIGKLLGVPYVPVTPYLLAVPRPVACQIYYSKPMVFSGDGTEEDEVIQGYVQAVKERIAALIELGAERRRLGQLEAPPELPGDAGFKGATA